MNLRIYSIAVIMVTLTSLLTSCNDYRVSPDQSEYFTKYYGGPGIDNGQTIRNTPDGGYIIAGTIENTTLGHEQAYIAKLDNKGELQWQKTLGDTTTFGTSVNLVSTGGYILCGYVMNKTDSDIVLYKFDNGGSLVAERVYNRAQNQEPSDIIEVYTNTYAGDFLVVGRLNNSQVGFNIFDSDLSNPTFEVNIASSATSIARVIGEDSEFYWAVGTNGNSLYVQRIEVSSIAGFSGAVGNFNNTGSTRGFDIIDSKKGTNASLQGSIFCLGTNTTSNGIDMVIYEVEKDQVNDEIKTITILDDRDITARSLVLDGKSIVVGGTIESDLGDPQVMFMKLDTTTTYIPEYITNIGGGDTETGNYIVKAKDGGYVQIGNASSDEGNTIISVIKVKANGKQQPE